MSDSVRNVRDRGPERRLARGPCGIHVNPLVIPGGLGELVDARLRDLHPAAGGDLLADTAAERANVEFDHDRPVQEPSCYVATAGSL